MRTRMLINAEDREKLEAVKNYSPRELRIIIDFLERGMFYDNLGQPYTPEYIKSLINNFGVHNA